MTPFSNPSYLLPPLVILIASLILVAIVLRSTRRSFSDWLFCGVLASMGLQALLLFGMRSSPDVYHALRWERALPVSFFAMFAFYYHFTLTYTHYTRQKHVLLASYLVLLILISVVFIPTNLIIKEMRLEDYGYAPVLGPLAILVSLGGIALMAGGVYNLLKRYKLSSSYEERNRMLYLAIAVFFPLTGSLLDGFTNLPPMALWSILIFCIICSTAIVKYHLLDIRLVVRKSLVYLLMSAMVGIPYASTLLLLNQILKTRIEPLWVHALIILLLALFLRPLYSWAQQFVDRLFYRDRYNYLIALEHFSRQAQSVTKLEELSSTMVQLVSGALRVSSTCLLLPSEGKHGLVEVSCTGLESPPSGVVLRDSSPLIKWLELHGDILSSEQLDIVPQLQSLSRKEKNELERMGAELYVPIKTRQSQLSGILVLGQKLSQESYSGEDKQLLKTVSNQMAIALDNARLYEETRRSEKALEESERHYRLLAENAKDTIWTVDMNMRPTYISPSITYLLGYSVEEAMALPMEAVYTPASFDIAMKVLAEELAIENMEQKDLSRSRTLELELNRKDGSIVPVEGKFTFIRGPDGQPVEILAITRDITEHKQVEGELRQSREQLRDLSAHLQSAREAERASIAREIHDELGQALTALKMDLSWLGKRLPKDQVSLYEKLKSTSRLTDVTLQTVKRISAELRPGLLDDLGLIAAIEWQAGEFTNRTVIKCQLSLGSDDIVVDRECATTVFRIFQETLTNIARHANATRAKVSLREKAGRLVLKVRDNGKGITQEQITNSKSLGLMGIRERARSQGGEVEISGIRYKGTTVTLNIPIDRKGETR